MLRGVQTPKIYKFDFDIQSIELTDNHSKTGKYYSGSPLIFYWTPNIIVLIVAAQLPLIHSAHKYAHAFIPEGVSSWIFKIFTRTYLGLRVLKSLINDYTYLYFGTS